MDTENFKNGKKAEEIVRGLLSEAGFRVVNYGYEYTVKELADRTNLITGPAADYIRHMPDFVIIDKNNVAYFVEVKFRSKSMSKNEIFNYPNGIVILLNKYGILAQSVEYIHKKGYDFTYLSKIPPFKNIPVETMIKYHKKVRRVLGDETLGGQIVENFLERFTNKKFEQPPIIPKEGILIERRLRS